MGGVAGEVSTMIFRRLALKTRGRNENMYSGFVKGTESVGDVRYAAAIWL
jgi:hypothetical protein